MKEFRKCHYIKHYIWGCSIKLTIDRSLQRSGLSRLVITVELLNLINASVAKTTLIANPNDFYRLSSLHTLHSSLFSAFHALPSYQQLEDRSYRYHSIRKNIELNFIGWPAAANSSYILFACCAPAICPLTALQLYLINNS